MENGMSWRGLAKFNSKMHQILFLCTPFSHQRLHHQQIAWKTKKMPRKWVPNKGICLPCHDKALVSSGCCPPKDLATPFFDPLRPSLIMRIMHESGVLNFNCLNNKRLRCDLPIHLKKIFCLHLTASMGGLLPWVRLSVEYSVRSRERTCLITL